MKATLVRFSVVIGVTGSIAMANFVVPDGDIFPWARGSSADSAWAQWEVFESPSGPNAPDVGSFFGGIVPPGAPAWDVYDGTGAAFITSGGNIYSFAEPLDITVVAPGFDYGPGHITTVLLQVRTQGSEVDHATVRIGDAAPVDSVELHRETLGGGFGGVLVDMLYIFELEGSEASYTIRFNAEASSLSLDRVAVDTYTVAVPPSCVGDANGDGFVNGADLSVLLAQFGMSIKAGSGADFNSDGVVNGADLSVFLSNFGRECRG